MDVVFVWLKEYGKLEYDDTTRRELLNEWDDATMAKVGIRFTPNAIWDWLDYVETLGEELGRSLSQRRKKLLSGFPESFDVITSPMTLRQADLTCMPYVKHFTQSGITALRPAR